MQPTRRNIGLSIDPYPAPPPKDALPPDFPTRYPHKVWWNCSARDYGVDWTEVLELPSRQYQFTVGVDAPPGREWQILLHVFVEVDGGVYRQGILDWTEVNSEKPASTIINITNYPAKYGSWRIGTLPFYGPILGDLGGAFKPPPYPGICTSLSPEDALWRHVLDWLPCVRDNLVYQHPEVGNWLLPRTLTHYSGDPTIEQSTVSIPVVTGPLGQFIFPTSCFRALYGHYWEDAYLQLKCPQALQAVLNPYTNARRLSSTDNIEISVYHVENDAPTIEQFWFGAGFLEKIPEWQYRLDHAIKLYLNPNEEYCFPPTNKYATFFPDVQNTVVLLQAPTDIRPGRRVFMIGCFYPTPGTPADHIAIPFIRIPETHPYWQIKPYFISVWGTPWGTRVYCDIHEFPITEEMIRKGGFTYQVGHYVVGAGEDIYPMTPVIDAEAFYSFTRGFQRPIAADIKTVDLQPYTLPVWAVIKAVDLQPYEIAPPPPNVATVAGRVLSIFGPVSNAEISLNTRFKTKSAADGTFTITNVPFGTYTLTVKPTRLFPIPEKLLLKTVSKTLNITSTTVPTQLITLPLNYLNIGLMTGGALATIIAVDTLTKPKYLYY
jgi:hypothetical protein